jgi:transcription-repair coupling factor (superfamily II helicase)
MADRGDKITLGGAPEGFDARLVLSELAKSAAVIHIARDDKRMEAMRAAIAVMDPSAVVFELPAWDCLPYDRVSPNPAILSHRMATLAALAGGVTGNDFECRDATSAQPCHAANGVFCGGS